MSLVLVAPSSNTKGLIASELVDTLLAAVLNIYIAATYGLPMFASDSEAEAARDGMIVVLVDNDIVPIEDTLNAPAIQYEYTTILSVEILLVLANAIVLRSEMEQFPNDVLLACESFCNDPPYTTTASLDTLAAPPKDILVVAEMSAVPLEELPAASNVNVIGTGAYILATPLDVLVDSLSGTNTLVASVLLEELAAPPNGVCVAALAAKVSLEELLAPPSGIV